MLGGIAEATERLRVGTGVTCPTTRIHPAIVAQAAATAAAMLPGRFFLGVGSGENLNEHILGDRWPETAVRQEMLEEAIEVIRLLWEGGLQSHHGKHYTVENARLYTLPEEPPPIIVAAAGPAGRRSWPGGSATASSGSFPTRSVIEQFEKAGGKGEAEVRSGARLLGRLGGGGEGRRRCEWWPNAASPGNLTWELPLPSHFEDGIGDGSMRTPSPRSVVCGPDPERHLEAIREFIDAGYDHVYFHQVGPDQEGFLQFAEAELLPRLQ